MPDADRLLTILIDGCSRVGTELSEPQIEQFRVYQGLLLDEAVKLGISGIEDPDEIERRHLLESAALLPVLAEAGVSLEGASLVDVGSGAGIPGVPLKVLLPELRLTLLEVKSRRVRFLERVTRELSLSQVWLVNERAEDAGRDPRERERYDVATAKAIAPLRVLAELTLPFLRVGGWLVAPKGGEARVEAEAAQRALAELGGELRGVVALPLAKLPQFVVLVQKTRPMPERYPRRSGLPARRPL